jgi:ubiquitin-conjugating enzyme E2 S
MKEIRKLSKNPPEGITVYVSQDNISNIYADIEGPHGTPFEGGVFRCKLVLGNDFPQAPPKGYFLTKIFHPNVSKAGEICVNTLKQDWTAKLGIQHVLVVIRCLLIHPNPASALNEEAGKLLLDKYADYAKRAKLMTRIHARAKPMPGSNYLASGPSPYSRLAEAAANAKVYAASSSSSSSSSSTSKSEGKASPAKKLKTSNEPSSVAAEFTSKAMLCDVSAAASASEAIAATMAFASSAAAQKTKKSRKRKFGGKKKNLKRL